MKSAGSKKISI